MLAASELPPRARRIASELIHRGWAWISAVGLIGPDDERGRRYRQFGRASAIAFPPGAVFGEWWISIGSATLVGPMVNLAVGMGPDEPRDPDAPPVIHIGDRCSIGRGSSIVARCGVVIEDDVTIAPDVYITDHNHTYGDVTVPIGRQWPAEDPVRIGAGSWLATGAVVLPGADIGRNVTVAAASVVRGTIPDYAVVAGNPARPVRQFVEGEGWVPPLRDHNIRAPEGWTAT